GVSAEWHLDQRNFWSIKDLWLITYRLPHPWRDRRQSHLVSIRRICAPEQSARRQSPPIDRIGSPFNCGLCADLSAIRVSARSAQPRPACALRSRGPEQKMLRREFTSACRSSARWALRVARACRGDRRAQLAPSAFRSLSAAGVFGGLAARVRDA